LTSLADLFRVGAKYSSVTVSPTLFRLPLSLKLDIISMQRDLALDEAVGSDRVVWQACFIRAEPH